jgi:hypothetical protein
MNAQLEKLSPLLDARREELENQEILDWIKRGGDPWPEFTAVPDTKRGILAFGDGFKQWSMRH